MLKLNRTIQVAGMALLTLAVLTGAPAMAKTTAASGYWTNGATWVGGVAPVTGDDAAVAPGHSVTVDVSTVSLNTFTNDGTLTFVGWGTTLTATGMTIRGIVTHVAQSATTTNLAGAWEEDAAIRIVCGNLAVEGGGRIDANEKGFGAPATLSRNGYGPGGGFYAASRNSGGGGHGGKGGSPTGGVSYGTAATPDRAGSGGATVNGVGGSGGGAIFITASGPVTVNGTVTVNGGPGGSGYGGDPGCGGSGGAIAISCQSLSGTGTIAADGGDSGLQIVSPVYYRNGGGAGGRVAITYDAGEQAGQSALILLSAAEGRGRDGCFGEPGTVWLTGTHLLRETMRGGQFLIAGWTNWTVAGLSIDKGTLVFPEAMALTVTGDVVLTNTGALRLSNATTRIDGYWTSTSTNPAADSKSTSIIHGQAGDSVAVGGDLTLKQASLAVYGIGMTVGGDFRMTNTSLFVVSAETVLGPSPTSALVEAGGDMILATGSWIRVVSNPTNGSSPRFSVASLAVGAGSGLTASGLGFVGATALSSSGGKGWGPGGGTNGSVAGTSIGAGGGYGGVGGSNDVAAGGNTYGKANGPTEPGSGGGRSSSVVGGAGGGLIYVASRGAIEMNGTMSANGVAGLSSAGCPSGGGSGGGVFLTCSRFSGSGSIQANGGDGGWQVAVPARSGGSGGGGRIAVMCQASASFVGSLSATNGTANAGFTGDIEAMSGEPGTILVRVTRGTVILLM